MSILAEFVLSEGLWWVAGALNNMLVEHVNRTRRRKAYRTRKTTDNNHEKINCKNKNNPRQLSIIRNNINGTTPNIRCTLQLKVYTVTSAYINQNMIF